jgi:hypothetical protein
LAAVLSKLKPVVLDAVEKGKRSKRADLNCPHFRIRTWLQMPPPRQEKHKVEVCFWTDGFAQLPGLFPADISAGMMHAAGAGSASLGYRAPAY